MNKQPSQSYLEQFKKSQQKITNQPQDLYTVKGHDKTQPRHTMSSSHDNFQTKQLLKEARASMESINSSVQRKNSATQKYQMHLGLNNGANSNSQTSLPLYQQLGNENQEIQPTIQQNTNKYLQNYYDINSYLGVGFVGKSQIQEQGFNMKNDEVLKKNFINRKRVQFEESLESSICDDTESLQKENHKRGNLLKQNSGEEIFIDDENQNNFQSISDKVNDKHFTTKNNFQKQNIKVQNKKNTNTTVKQKKSTQKSQTSRAELKQQNITEEAQKSKKINATTQQTTINSRRILSENNSKVRNNSGASSLSSHRISNSQRCLHLLSSVLSQQRQVQSFKILPQAPIQQNQSNPLSPQAQSKHISPQINNVQITNINIKSTAKSNFQQMLQTQQKQAPESKYRKSPIIQHNQPEQKILHKQNKINQKQQKPQDSKVADQFKSHHSERSSGVELISKEMISYQNAVLYQQATPRISNTQIYQGQDIQKDVNNDEEEDIVSDLAQSDTVKFVKSVKVLQNQQTNSEIKGFLKADIGDFKSRILGAMQTTNQAVLDAGKNKIDIPLISNEMDFIDKVSKDSPVILNSSRNQKLKVYGSHLVQDSITASQRERFKNTSPSAQGMPYPHYDDQLQLVFQNSEGPFSQNVMIKFRPKSSSNTKKNLQLDQDQIENSNCNSEIQFNANTETSQKVSLKRQSNIQSQNGPIEINKHQLDEFYKLSDKRVENNQQFNSLNKNKISNPRSNKLFSPQPIFDANLKMFQKENFDGLSTRDFDRFDSPHFEPNSKIKSYMQNSQKAIPTNNNLNNFGNITSRGFRSQSQFSNFQDKPSSIGGAIGWSSSKIDELMNNPKLQQILLDNRASQQDESRSDLLGSLGSTQRPSDEQIEMILCHVNNFLLRHHIQPQSSNGKTENLSASYKQDTSQTFSPQEQFLLQMIEKLASYIEQIKGKELANKQLERQKKSKRGGQKKQKEMNTSQDSDNKEQVYEKLGQAEIRMKRLLKQIQEMNVEYKCQKTQVETLERFNESLTNQIKRLQQQKREQGQQTPRQMFLRQSEDKRSQLLSPGVLSPNSGQTNQWAQHKQF